MSIIFLYFKDFWLFLPKFFFCFVYFFFILKIFIDTIFETKKLPQKQSMIQYIRSANLIYILYHLLLCGSLLPALINQPDAVFFTISEPGIPWFSVRNNIVDAFKVGQTYKGRLVKFGMIHQKSHFLGLV